MLVVLPTGFLLLAWQQLRLNWKRPSSFGEVPEWSNGAGCKPVGVAYDGSNPSLPTNLCEAIKGNFI